MVDLWKLGWSLFMFAVLIVLVEVATELSSAETGLVVFIVGILGFILSLIGSIIGGEKKTSKVS